MPSEAGVDILKERVDRAHRVRPSYYDKISNVECKSVIVCFTTFRQRIVVYIIERKRKWNQG